MAPELTRRIFFLHITYLLLIAVCVILIPIMSFNLNFCPNFNLWEKIAVFRDLASRGVVSQTQICSFTSIFAVYFMVVLFVSAAFSIPLYIRIRDDLIIPSRNFLAATKRQCSTALAATLLWGFVLIIFTSLPAEGGRGGIISYSGAIPVKYRANLREDKKNFFLLMVSMSGEPLWLSFWLSSALAIALQKVLGPPEVAA